MRIERECVTHRFIHARPAITAWQCRDVEEYGITSFRRRNKSEPTFVVPFCDFSLATHFLFFKRSNARLQLRRAISIQAEGKKIT
jgi:hypothetical protein